MTFLLVCNLGTNFFNNRLFNNNNQPYLRCTNQEIPIQQCIILRTWPKIHYQLCICLDHEKSCCNSIYFRKNILRNSFCYYCSHVGHQHTWNVPSGLTSHPGRVLWGRVGVANHYPRVDAISNFLQIPFDCMSVWNMEKVFQIQVASAHGLKPWAIFIKNLKLFIPIFVDPILVDLADG